MKAPQIANKTLIFTTSIGETKDPNEFIIEFYSYSPDLKLKDPPLFVIHNFDELIDFFEKGEEI